MSKKKLFLLGAILMLAILAFQVSLLVNYDHFKAEGGLKIEFSVDPSEVVKRYSRSSLDFDNVMEGAILAHKQNGGDFFSEFAKANKGRLQRPLIRLMNYKEINGLSSSSKDNEVIEFLRTKLEANLEGTASFLTVRIKNVFKKLVEVKFDSKELTLNTELVAYDRKIKPKQLEVPEIKVGFYEVMTAQEFSSYWNTLCELTKRDTLPEENSEDWKLTDYDQSSVPSQNLANCVQWQNRVSGIVQEKDKEYVDEVFHSEVFDEAFPKQLEVRWSFKSPVSGMGNVWQFYIIRVPENGVPRITENDIRSAETGADEYGKHVSLRMDQEGAEKWKAMTEDNVGRLIAMCVNDIVLSAPHVVSPITDGNTQISGSNILDVKSIAFSLNTKSPDLKPFVKSQSIVKGDPPTLNALVQQMLIAVSSILLLFFSIMFVRNLRVN